VTAPRPWQHVPVTFVNPRMVRFEAAFTFETWTVPAGYVSDGASIPALFWWVPFIGHPLMGDVLYPSGLHDYLMEMMFTLSAMETHRTFYRALRYNGVGRVRASLFFAATVLKNPWWKR